jgi:hypothetical protein
MQSVMFNFERKGYVIVKEADEEEVCTSFQSTLRQSLSMFLIQRTKNTLTTVGVKWVPNGGNQLSDRLADSLRRQ